MLVRHGYTIKVLNTINFAKSMHYNDQTPDLPESIRHHQALLDAIRDKDEALAAQLAREIVARGITAITPQYDWGNN